MQGLFKNLNKNMGKLVLDPKRQRGIWKHMHKDCLVRLCSSDQYKKRFAILEEIQHEVEHGQYSPKALHGFLSASKGNGIPRFVPVLNHVDVAVYFGCIMALDEELAAQRVEDTFGGFSLGGQRRKFEESQFNKDIEHLHEIHESAPSSPYNPFGWLKDWLQFSSVAQISYETAPEGSWFVEFDIANFYDTVDLPKLERAIRRCCPKSEFEIEVLMYLLSNWNKNVNRYVPTTLR